MARVRVNIERKSDADYVMFTDDRSSRTYGRKCRFSDKGLVFEMLRRGGGSESLCSLVENDLHCNGRSFAVLDLTEEQFVKIRDRR